MDVADHGFSFEDGLFGASQAKAFGYVGDAVDADVDYGGAGTDLIGGDVGGAADGGN